jgi:formylmethanofuran dehydrogenase subunit E-like metal-binding protein
MVILCIGIIIGMFVIGLTKPRYNKTKTVYTYVNVPDWSSEKNPRKIAYYEHLAR